MSEGPTMVDAETQTMMEERQRIPSGGRPRMKIGMMSERGKRMRSNEFKNFIKEKLQG
jgi:hypothetical protein